MGPQSSAGRPKVRVRFGEFELNGATGELSRRGRRIKLQYQPFRMLELLLERPGALVAREELHDALWPNETFGEFDAGLGNAVRKIRLALGDDAANPRFVQTVPKQGFRFIAPVHYPMAEPPAQVDAAPPQLQIVQPPTREVEVPAAPSAGTPEEPYGETGVAPGSVSWRSRLWWRLAVGVLIATCGAAILILMPGRSVTSEPTLRLAMDLPPGQEFQYYSGRQLAISPDGTTLAWIAAFNNVRQIYARKLDATDFWPLAGTERATSLCFSPDGGWVAYLSQAGELRKASVDGRWNVKLLSLGPKSQNGNVVWGPDGWVYFVADHFRSIGDSRRMFRVRETGGEPEAELPDSQPAGAQYPMQWLSRGILLTASYVPSDQVVDLWIPADRKMRELVHHASGGRYLPSGHLVFDQSGNLMAAPFDLDRMEVRGKPVLVEPDVAPDRWSGLQMDVSGTGTLVYFRGVNVHERQPVWVDRSGHESPANLPSGRYHLMDISLDGRLLLARYDAGDRFTTYSLEPDKSGWKEIFSDESPNASGVWSPDGRSVAVAAAFQRERFATVYVKPLDGAEAHPLLGDSYAGRYPQSWSRSANAIAYTDGWHEATKRDIYVLPLASGAEPRCIACTPEDDIWPSFSPDGHWIAYTSAVSGRFEIYAQRYPGPSAPVRISLEGGQNSLWAPSGRELYYRRGNDVWAVSFDANAGKAGTGRRLFSGKYDSSNLWVRDWLLSPDGNRFLMLKVKDDPPDYRRIQVVVNWFDELRKSVKGSW